VSVVTLLSPLLRSDPHQDSWSYLLRSVKKKHCHILEEIKSGYEAQARVSARHHLNKQEEWKSNFLLAKLKLEKETENWKQKLHNLDIELASAKDC
jgi:hypothetical protein